jgi:hypothetical protein
VIRHGTTRTWTTPWFAGPTSLSLSADGSQLGSVDLTQQSPASSLGSAWVLATNSPPGDAAAHSRKVFTDVMHGGIQAQSEVLSPDGLTMYILITGAASTFRQLPVARATLSSPWPGNGFMIV